LDASGQVVEHGDYTSLISQNGYVHSLDVCFKQEPARSPEQDAEHVTDPADTNRPSHTADLLNEDNKTAQELMRRTGEWRLYKHWLKSCGTVSSALSLLWAICWVIAAQMPGILVKYFGDSSSQATTFIVIFGMASMLAVGSVMMVAVQIFLFMIPKSSSNLHLNLIQVVVDAPLSFFTKTDVGLITNHFSQDMALLDSELPFSYADFILSFVNTGFSLALIGASGAGYFAAVIPFVLGALYAIQKYYLRTSRQLRLLDLEEKAPLYTLFGETASGLASVRAFGWNEKFAERNLELLDRSQRPFYLLFAVQQWLTLVLNLLVAVLITVLMVVIVVKRNSIQPGLVGLGLLSLVNLSDSLTNVVRNWTQLETSIGAVSRLRDFARNTESEHKSWELDPVDGQWPNKGEVNFMGFEASYSGDSVLVLKNIELDVHHGEKIGICGRSGAGKSSILSSLFHVLEFRNGKIQIDGVDIAQIPRETLRKRLSVIPQEPWWITTESVRFNMDPWNAADTESGSNGNNTGETSQERDEAFISALTRCQVWPIIQEKGGLGATMTQDFLSHGQRQLFCLARALVRQSKVVVLDEVSANVDVKTDELMQKIIREEFKDCTVIAVAHRLNTIVDFDRVVVLSKGEIVEAGQPGKLLATRGSAFKALYES
jgi:ATP-binding cassette, subfamily C (CFTR/MRP), member 1